MTEKGRDASGLQAIQWSDQAKDDLATIGDYIAEDNPVAAVRWLDLFAADIKRAAEYPKSGRIVPEHGRPEIREVIRGSYRIIYQVKENAIEVLTIFEGHRLFPEGVLPDERDKEG